MSEVHVISLREPWDRANEAGRVVLRRRFGRPTNIGADSVWLVVQGCSAEVTLNDRQLGEVEGTGAFNVTTRMNERNLIELKLYVGEFAGEVRLEIRATDS